MLLEFRIGNYKSFIDEVSFSMFAAPKQSLDYSVIKINNVNVLSSSVIYGPNASGKTNLISAMDTFRSLVLRGNIKNVHDKKIENRASCSLELIPNSKLTEKKPTEFYVDFYENDKRIQYYLAVDLGMFSEDDYDRSIVREELRINETMIFDRGKTVKLCSEKIFEKLIGKVKSLQTLNDMANRSLNKTELFLTNGFKILFSGEITSFITEWFENKFLVFCSSNYLITKPNGANAKTMIINKDIIEGAKIFGSTSDVLGYGKVSEDNDSTKIYSIFKTKDKNVAIPSEIYESLGTYRFINILPILIDTLNSGATLVMDEFDASIHPMALMNIINIFHNDEININHAQLIFNTHNPIFLNGNLFRRDEIKFVDKDEDSKSEIYSLADFGTSGEDGVRKGEDYLKNYFVNKYGAIKDVDFAPLFKSIIQKNNKKRNAVNNEETE